MADYIVGIGNRQGMEGLYVILQKGNAFFHTPALPGGGENTQAPGTQASVVKGADDKIQSVSCLGQSLGNTCRIDFAVSHFHTQTDFQLIPKQLPGSMALGIGRRPVPGMRQRVSLLSQQIPVVRNSQFLEPCVQGGLRLLFQGSGTVAGNQGMQMVIGAIHKGTSSFFALAAGGFFLPGEFYIN